MHTTAYQVVSLENRNLVILGEMCINDKFVEIMTVWNLCLLKWCNLRIHQLLENLCWLRWCIMCIHLILSHLGWEEGSRAKDFKPSACWEVTQLNQICYLFLILLCFVLFLFFFWFIYFNDECMCLGRLLSLCMIDLHWRQFKI